MVEQGLASSKNDDYIDGAARVLGSNSSGGDGSKVAEMYHFVSSRCVAIKRAISTKEIRLPSSTRDAIKTVRELLEDYVFIPIHAKVQLERKNYSHSAELYFWKSETAMWVYVDVTVAVILGKSWILYGAMLLLLMQIGWIVIKWILYALDDPELEYCINYVKTWVKRFVNEGEKILKGEDATRYIVSYTFLRSVPTGFSYFRWLLRYNMRQGNLHYVQTVVSDRYGSSFLSREDLQRRREEIRARLSAAGQALQYKVNDTGDCIQSIKLGGAGGRGGEGRKSNRTTTSWNGDNALPGNMTTKSY